MSGVTYQAMPIPRVMFPVIFVVFAVVAVVLAVAPVRGAGPPVAFLVLWLFVFGWNVYWWTLRICLEVGVDGRTLNWRTGVRGGQAPVDDVTCVRPSRLNRQFAVIELQGRRPLLVPVRYGFGELTAAIAAAAPHASIDRG